MTKRMCLDNNINEEELTKTLVEVSTRPDSEDFIKTLKVISDKMYKIKSFELHRLYDKYSKEFARRELKRKSENQLLDLKDRIECGDLDYDNKIEIKGIALADVDILSIIYDLLEIED